MTLEDSEATPDLMSGFLRRLPNSSSRQEHSIKTPTKRSRTERSGVERREATRHRKTTQSVRESTTSRDRLTATEKAAGTHEDHMRTNDDKNYQGQKPGEKTGAAFALSQQARTELKEILARQAGADAVSCLSDDDVDHFGHFLLTVHAEALKIRLPMAVK